VAGDAIDADAFGDRGALALQHAVMEPAVERGARRVGEGDLYSGFAALQIGADPGDSAAATGSAGETIHLAFGLFPDFRPSRFEMGLTICRVVGLVGVEGAIGLCLVQLAREPTGEVHEMVRA